MGLTQQESESYSLSMPVVPVVTPDGARIRQVRERLEMSRADVAARMARHRHPKQIDMIERGKKDRVSRTYMQELADALGRPVDEFIKVSEAA